MMQMMIMIQDTIRVHAPGKHKNIRGKFPELSQNILWTFQATFDFVPENEGDLGLRIGDLIQVLEEENDSWWRGINLASNLTGIFPSNFIKASHHVIDISCTVHARIVDNAIVMMSGWCHPDIENVMTDFDMNRRSLLASQKNSSSTTRHLHAWWERCLTTTLQQKMRSVLRRETWLSCWLRMIMDGGMVSILKDRPACFLLISQQRNKPLYNVFIRVF